MKTPTRTDPTTILHVITNLETGGAELSLARLIEATESREYRHVVVTMTDGGTVGPRIAAAGAAVHALGMGRGSPKLSALFRLRRLIRETRPDIVQTWLYHADLLGMVAAWLAGHRRIVWTLRCSDMDLGRYSKTTLRVRWLLARLSRLPDLVIANSRAGIAYHRSLGYRPRRWELIHNGVDVGAFRRDPVKRAAVRARLKLTDDAVAVGVASRWDAMKDHRTFLQAAGTVHRRTPGFVILLAGRGCTPDNAEMTREISEAGLGGIVVPVGEQSDMAGFLSALDVFCLSSAFGEGFSNTLAEAMAASLPCIATDVGDGAEILGDTGWIVPPRDDGAFAQALSEALALTAGEREAKGGAASARVAAEFPLAGAVARYRALYDELTRAKPSTSE